MAKRKRLECTNITILDVDFGKSSHRCHIRYEVPGAEFFPVSSNEFTRREYKKSPPRWTVCYDRGVWVEINEYREGNPFSPCPTTEQLEAAFQELKAKTDL